MENKKIARTLRLLSHLMELHEENPFKIKSIANAAFKIDKLPFKIAGKPAGEIEKIEGIGKSTAAKIEELIKTDSITDLEALLQSTPEGVVEMLGIKGLGPKKIAIIWRDLHIENIGELLYACNENRLVEAKGFGLKTQEEIKKMIEFRMASNGSFLYAQVEPEAAKLFDSLKAVLPDSLMDFSGQYRRNCEIINELSIVIGTRDPSIGISAITDAELLMNFKIDECHLTGELENGLMVELICVEKRYYFKELFKQTGSEEHVDEVLKRIADQDIDQPESEQLIYLKAGLLWIHPELREGTDILNSAIPTELITPGDLVGTLHNHSDWSDGVNSIKDMALYCRNELKLQYLGICDHSKSAIYAKGLSIERVYAQHKEIDALNKELDNFHIFKGTEADILNDGSLDYPDEVLKTFDFVVASVHSNLRMEKSKATARLIKAIENPYTTILGHPTGRLLLTRKGYEINYEKVIDACAANNVVIEINANPLRLDLDWRWQGYALTKGVMLSINPDAHRVESFHDMKYGVLVARKAGLTREHCLNAHDLAAITEIFKKKKP
ncbi:DNA polymerase/3'-5' exonuclease PolX [Mucilaginibacter ginkgonis]|uniref:DNA polymerase/3'-5' exonuclease PolX n=1 Tax=Mucilaginibacter ginkgonis TaxID=2682091 RepID=A0A6I4I2A5_9SPHI|nr:DNA polymerase/3'-5' exonuclease PolX [Mucilaginibacter ginkgonis]QQL50713.1 DNA polymerase/3'-5' exonuclease PolX [Mucilaginibacter ginkgonis]